MLDNLCILSLSHTHTHTHTAQAELFARFRNQAAAALAHGGPGGLGGGPVGGGASPGMGGGKQVSEEEAADANQRNRAISSSAISRAMSDANAGQYNFSNKSVFRVHVYSR